LLPAQEARLALAQLYSRVALELVPEGCQAPLELVNGVTLGPRDGIRVRVHERLRRMHSC
jgi:hypothetical protein